MSELTFSELTAHGFLSKGSCKLRGAYPQLKHLTPHVYSVLTQADLIQKPRGDTKVRTPAAQARINGRVASGQTSGIRFVPKQTRGSIHCGYRLGNKRSPE